MSTVPHSLEPVHFSPQTIYCGDCLEILEHFPANCVDLIYIDPPFNSNRNYEVFWGDVAEKRAFDDRYGDAMAYIGYMRPRVEQLHRVLKTTGSFYYHCDWHASHYIKVMLDEIFGANFFVNEITWKRADAHSDARQGAKHFGRITDNIFFYTKTAQYAFNTYYLPLPESTAEKWYRHVEPETGRRYNMADLTAAKPGGDTKFEFHGAVPPSGRYWAYSKDKMEDMLLAGLIVFTKSGKPYMKRYLDESKGVPLQNLWDDISQLRGITRGGERLGYPTQKPSPLLERIIKASSNPGDIVLDAFCGCGTALVAAQKLGRRWLGIDISPTSVAVMGARLEKDCGLRQAPVSLSAEQVAQSWDAPAAAAGMKPGERQAYYRYSNLPRSAEDLRKLPGFEFENWAVLQLGEVLKHQGHRISAQVNRAKVGDFGLDGKIYLVTSTSIKRDGKRLFSGQEDYIPIQVKNKDKASRPDIDSFAHALTRDERSVGFFIAWDFTKDALTEIARLAKAGGKGGGGAGVPPAGPATGNPALRGTAPPDSPTGETPAPPSRPTGRPPQQSMVIIPVPVQKLIAETFDSELLALMGV